MWSYHDGMCEKCILDIGLMQKAGIITGETLPLTFVLPLLLVDYSVNIY